MKRNFFTICGAVLTVIILTLSIPAAFIGGFFAYVAMGGPWIILAGGKVLFGWEIPPMRFTPTTPAVYVCNYIGAIIQWIFKGDKMENKKHSQ